MLFNGENNFPGQIVSLLAGKFSIFKKAASAITDKVAALAVSETKKAGSFTLPGIGKLVLVKRKATASISRMMERTSLSITPP